MARISQRPKHSVKTGTYKITHAHLINKKTEAKCELCDVKPTVEPFKITFPKYNQEQTRYQALNKIDFLITLNL